MDIVKQLTLNSSAKDAPLGSIVCAKNIMLDESASYITRELAIVLNWSIPGEGKIVGIIPIVDKLVIFTTKVDNSGNPIVHSGKIYVKADNENLAIESNVKWDWSGGTITGDGSYNYKGDLIVVVAESSDNTDIPLKIYNLSSDEELEGLQEAFIPELISDAYINDEGSLICGSYTFFIRFKRSENNYTKWFQVTSDIHIISEYEKDLPKHSYQDPNAGETTLGSHIIVANSINGVDSTKPANFILNKNRVSNKNIILKFENIDTSFDYYQIGAIVRHNTETKCHIIGEYHKTTDIINITNNFYIEDTDLSEFLKIPTQYYNVKNAIVYNNRLYISNYKEYPIDENIDTSQITIGYKRTQVDAATSVQVEEITHNINSIISWYLDVNCVDNTSTIKLNNRNYIIDPYTWITENIVEPFEIEGLKTVLFQMAYDNITTFYNLAIDSVTEFNVSNENYELNGNKVETIKFSPYIGFIGTNREAYAFYTPYLGTRDRYTRAGKNKVKNDITIKVDETNPNNISLLFTINNNEFEISSTDIIPIYIGFQIEFTYITNRGLGLSKHIAKFVNSNGTFDGTDYDIETVPADYIDDCPEYNVLIEKSQINEDIHVVSPVMNNRTLVPYQRYNYFIHFVRKDGSVTNGYFIARDFFSLSTFAYGECIAPVFGSVVNPNTDLYTQWFITYEDVVKNAYSGIVIDTNLGGGGNDTIKITSSDFIYNNKNFSGTILVINNVEYTGSITNISNIITQTPYVEFTFNSETIPSVNIGDRVFLVFSNTDNVYNSTNKRLYRLTDNYNFGTSVENQNNYKYLPGYYSLEKIATFINTSDSLQSIIASPVSNYVISTDKTTFGNKTKYNIKNYNIGNYFHVDINALSVKQDYNEGSFAISYKSATIVEGERVEEEMSDTYYNKVLSPDMIQDFLELYPAYNTTPDKIYTNYKESYKTEFNQTVRRSDVLSDESAYIGFRNFETNNYKNIFENKGDIVNICGIGLYVLIHTQYSLYFIDRTSRLTSQAQLVTPDTFDTSYQEAAPSNEGFGGLEDKKEAILTKYGYIWLDKRNKYIFRFDSGKMTVMSKDINAFLQKETIISCRFGEDVKRNRLLICLGLERIKNSVATTIYVTFSYNFNTNTFISLHDYKFDDAYNTYNELYLVNNDYPNRLFTFGAGSSYGLLYYFNNDIFNTYPILLENSQQSVVSENYIDIIFNEHIETPKLLNSITYILSKIESNKQYSFNFEGDLNRRYSGYKLVIYTDQCNSGLIDISVDNINELNAYKKPFYEKGKWNFNYFRSLLDVENMISAPATDRTPSVYEVTDISDVNNLPSQIYKYNNHYYKLPSDMSPRIHGRYFVIRFRFDGLKDFKFESLDINTTKY